ncbi:ABC transporter ATP-binding protein [Salibacterium halotolerans]|uniref:ABC-2 type transport system ATP-binding protein n=1 Tax=Salibacterium halotolerans TaxID=1884432 RepID=A0A1I5WTA1_9BACI|nr:ABC transporter ATP-binding protein [Salibacterium halotolerans]SFQ22964.1 ABC-2 type transport system ATP-binding protein [Salibacterium halotolerans]
MSSLLTTENVHVEMKKGQILKDVNLSFEKGKIYGLLGPNGAGKTTLLKTLLGVFQPTSGTVHFQGENLYNHPGNDLLKGIGSIIEFPGFYDNLTLSENLVLHLRYLQQQFTAGRIDALLQTVGLYNEKDKLFSDTSLGMKQRLGIARSISHQPMLLLLDEPTNGLDPHGIKEVREMLIKEVIQNNTTIVISSHLLNEINLMADELIFINHGEVIFETINMDVSDNFLYKLRTPFEMNRDFMSKLKAHMVLREGDQVEFVSPLSLEEIEEILIKEQVSIERLDVFELSLEDLYLKLLSEGEPNEFVSEK